MEAIRLSSLSLFIFSSCLIKHSTGSVITLENTPDKIQVLTKSLTIRCAINKTDLATTSSGVVGRDTGQTTSGDMQFIMSLVITRKEGEHVASISQVSPAKALVDLSNLHVSGDLSGSHDEQGYLELTWEYPNETQAGQYSCEANGMNSAGHSVIFSKSASITYVEPTLSSLIQATLDFEQEMKLKDQQILALLNRPNHIENGTLHCGDSSSWSSYHRLYKYRDVFHTFSSKYDKPPRVIIGVVRYRNQYMRNGHNYNVDFNTELLEVNETNFTIRCKEFDRNGHIYYLDVNWVSVAQ